MKWLDRDLILGPYLMLATNEQEFRDAMRHMEQAWSDHDPWVNKGADATTWSFCNPKGERVCVVCLRNDKDRSPIEIAGVLVHEAVHVWQEYRDGVGETKPSSEFEAYSIQAIAQRLMTAYRDQTSPNVEPKGKT